MQNEGMSAASETRPMVPCTRESELEVHMMWFHSNSYV